MKLAIKGIQKTSLVDYPGKIVSILFFGGCNFSCPYCHNPEIVLSHSDFPDIPPGEVLDMLSERKKWIDGVCLSGGEPTLHNDLTLFCREIKKLGLLIKLDTNGLYSERVKHLIEENLVDYISMDVKHSPEKYFSAIGFEKEKIVSVIDQVGKTISLIRESNVNYEFRTTVVPGIHSVEDVVNIAKWLEGSKRFCLQQFRAGKTLDKRYEDSETFSRETLLDLKEKIKDRFDTCEVRYHS